MIQRQWFRLPAVILLVLIPAIVFSHIHINPIVDHAKAISDFTVSWSSFQSLADTLKATSADLRKKEDILKLQSMGSDLKGRLPSLQKSFQEAIQKIAESGNDTPEFDTGIVDELAKTPGTAGITTLVRQSGARAMLKGFQADALNLEVDSIIAEVAGGPKTLRSGARSSCVLFASLQVFG